MRRTSLLTVLALTAGLAVSATPARAAGDTVVSLPVGGVRDLVVDAGRGRLYLTGSSGWDGVVVRDLDGAAVTTIGNLYDASGMTLSPDGTRLYVALRNGWDSTIAAIDTTTLAVVARYAIGDHTCPRSVSAVGSVVWFGYGCSTGNVGLLDLSGETPVVTLAKAPAEAAHLTSSAPVVAVTPDGSRMVAATPGTSPSYLYSLTVADGTLALDASRSVGDGLRDLAFTPDMTSVVTAAAGHHARYRVADLAEDGTFGEQLSGASAAAATASFVAAGSDGAPGNDLRVYAADGTLVRSYDVGGWPLPGGLAWGPDGTTLYVVGGGSGSAQLHVLRDPTKPPASLSLTAPASRRVGTPFTLTGVLAGPGEGKTLEVTRSSRYGTVALPDVTTGPDGAFAFSDTVAKRGGYTYTVTFEGDESYASATKGVAFGVAGLIPTLSITTDKPRYAFRSIAVVTARLSTWSTGKRLHIQARHHWGTENVRLADADANGYLTARYTITRRTAFYVSYPGDDVYEPRTVSITRDAHAWVRTWLQGYYATSNGYRLYRRSVHPAILVDVDPDRTGACLLFEAQQYRSGAWRTLATNTCLRTDWNGSVLAGLFGTHPVNVPHRIRVTFQGDTRNLRTVGAWQYLRFTY